MVGRKGEKGGRKEKLLTLSPSAFMDMFYLPIFPPNMCEDKQVLMLTRLEMGNFMAKAHVFRNFFCPLLSPASFFLTSYELFPVILLLTA